MVKAFASEYPDNWMVSLLQRQEFQDLHFLLEHHPNRILIELYIYRRALLEMLPFNPSSPRINSLDAQVRRRWVFMIRIVFLRLFGHVRDDRIKKFAGSIIH